MMVVGHVMKDLLERVVNGVEKWETMGTTIDNIYSHAEYYVTKLLF